MSEPLTEEDPYPDVSTDGIDVLSEGKLSLAGRV